MPKRVQGLVRLVTTELVECVAERGARLREPRQVGKLLQELIGNKDREHFVVLHLDNKHVVVAMDTVSIGTVSTAPVHPREVFKSAIISNATAIIVGHNHPSGDLEPSQDDRALCERLRACGELLGIPLLDFLIVTGESYLAFSESEWRS